MKKLPTLNPFFIWEIASFADSFSLFIIVKVRFRLFGLQVDRDLFFSLPCPAGYRRYETLPYF